ncbi:tubulin-folding cofactor B-like [Venturia canescens]|uniref:tubulin-folding cofactor B-like n=1 Tax=Venturia canescens TaxID=32260 RepID=UPI001C9C087F|nr:tubulin-folding cofactor B-like [Venturia canescens]
MSNFIPTCDFVILNITNSGNDLCCAERRFQKSITIDDFKGKLELLTGGNQATMRLEAYDKKNQLVCQPNEGSRLLGSYPIDSGMRIHVVDTSIPVDNLASVEKFQISEEEYSKRSDTVKAFLEKNKLGKYNEEDMKRKMEEKLRDAQIEEELAQNMKAGDRCEVRVPMQPKRKATIMYVGKTDFKEGWWVGLKYDEPLGKNDGTVNGKRYFECPPKYGSFVKPAHVVIGDFPEEDYDLNEEM